MAYHKKNNPFKHRQNNQPLQKKHLGQHFLISQDPINTMLSALTITPETTIVEIGCGNGILTKALLATSCKAVHVVEIDLDWATYIHNTIHDPRLTIHHEDALAFDFRSLKDDGPLLLMANLPYVITFPLFEKLATDHTVFDDGMVMIQEEAAERITHTSGRRCGAVSLFLQYYFAFSNYSKVPPSSFSPPPKVMSRLVRFTPHTELMPLINATEFWLFVRACFKNPRQMVGNNLKRTNYQWQQLPEATLQLRAQQLTVKELHDLWLLISQK